jgi:hypothetical protein
VIVVEATLVVLEVVAIMLVAVEVANAVTYTVLAGRVDETVAMP